MEKNGKTEEISLIPVDSVPQMGILIGSGEDQTIYRISIDTIVEYYDTESSSWVEGTVVSPDSVSVDGEIKKLNANTQIRLRDEPSTVGVLINDEIFSDIEYDAQDLQDLYRTLYGNGFINNYLFGKIEATGGLEITVTSGIAIVDGTVVAFRIPQKINVNSGLSTVRKDLLVLRRDLVGKRPYLYIKQGEANPSMPTPVPEQNVEGVYELPIAEIVVQPNVQTIYQSDITDVRVVIPNADYPVIEPFYVQYQDTDGKFKDDYEPTNYYKKMYNVDTTWELMFTNESAFFRTEGSHASQNRDNGFQSDAIVNLSGEFFAYGYGTFNQKYSYNIFDVTLTGHDNTYSEANAKWRMAKYNYNFGKIWKTTNEVRPRNRTMRLFKLISINGKNILPNRS